MSEIRATTISDAAGTGPITLTGQSAAKAWVNFNAIGTVAISNSVSTTSITDLGTGIYAANWTNSFSGADYSFSGTSVNGNIMGVYTPTGGMAAGTLSVLTWFNGTFSDLNPNSITAHGDLA